MTLSSSVQCLCALQDFVVFTSGGLLFVWPVGHPEPLASRRLAFEPAAVCGFENRLFLASSEAAAVLHITGGSEVYSLENLFIPPDGTKLFPLIAHASWSCDGSMVAVCSHSEVLVVDLSLHRHDDDVECLGESESPFEESFFELSCSQYFGRSEAVLTAWGPSKLFVVSKNNHMISYSHGDTPASNNDETSTSDAQPFVFFRDGQIVCAAAAATCLCSDALNEQLMVGLSNGRILVLNSCSLSCVFTLSVVDALRRAPSSGALSLENVECSITDVQLVSSLSFAVVTPTAVVSFLRSSLALQSEESVVPMDGVVTAASLSSSSHNVITWSTFSSQVHFFRLASKGSNLSSTDFIRSTLPLPVKYAVSPEAAPPGPDSVKAKAVTFGRPIKSSGYSSTQPWSVQQAAKAKLKNKTSGLVTKTASSRAMRRYDIAAPPPTAPMTKTNEALAVSKLHGSVISAAEFDGAGAYLVTGSGDTTLHTLKCPVSKFGTDGICSKGHTSLVTAVDVCLAIQHPLVVAGSADGTVSLWRPSRRSTPYIMHPTGKEVKAVRFGCMDQVIAYSSGSHLHFAKYVVDDGGGDLDRKRNLSKLDTVHSVTTSSQLVTCFDVFNDFLSTAAVWAGTNKQLSVYDFAAEQEVCSVSDAHSRAVHSLSLMRNSRFCSVSSDALHLAATASTDKTVRLWDLRAIQTPVRQFSQHTNSAIKVGMSLSPCGKFLAVGSEDRALYVYSVNTGGLMSKLSAPDVVTAVAFHPLDSSVVFAGCANGAACFFGNPSNK